MTSQAIVADATPIAAPADSPSGAAGDVEGRLHGEREGCQPFDSPGVTLLDALRERLDLTGTKKGCDHGQCGACTVHVNGRRVNRCLTFAVMHDGDRSRRSRGSASRTTSTPCRPRLSSTTAISAVLHAGSDHVRGRRC